MTHSSTRTITLAATLLLLAGPQGRAQESTPFGKNLKVIPADITKDELIERMKGVAGDLGVKCGFCHIPDDAPNDSKPTKLKAREMMKMVDTINATTFKNEKVKVRCYTCHRGLHEPQVAPPPPPPGSPAQPGAPAAPPPAGSAPPTAG